MTFLRKTALMQEEVCCSNKPLVVACRMPPKKTRIQPEVTSMGSPLLQKPEDTCVGNIENKDGTACGSEAQGYFINLNCQQGQKK